MRKVITLISFLSILFAMGCNTQEKILKSHDTNMKLTKANQYYDAHKWMKANEIYQSLMPVFKGTKYYEELCYRYCYSFYNAKDYLSASYQFKNFIEAFPNSERADECEFMYAKSMYMQTPRYSLDPTITEKAISVLQSYINSHPNSPNLIQANNYIEICQEKLETKDAERSKLYYNMKDYKAATVSYQLLIQDYPTSKVGDYYMFMRQKSFFEYAKSSIATKQANRYQKSIDAFKELKEFYPQTQYLAEATSLENEASNKINELNKKGKNED